jgi:hypothetical protein
MRPASLKKSHDIKQQTPSEPEITVPYTANNYSEGVNVQAAMQEWRLTPSL